MVSAVRGADAGIAVQERAGDDDTVAFRVIGPVLRLERRRGGGLYPLPDGTSTQVRVSVPHFCDPHLAEFLEKRSCDMDSAEAADDENMTQYCASSRATLAANLGLINVVQGIETAGSGDGTQLNQASDVTREHARVMLAFTDGQPSTRLRLCQSSRCGVTRASMQNSQRRDWDRRTHAHVAASVRMSGRRCDRCLFHQAWPHTHAPLASDSADAGAH